MDELLQEMINPPPRRRDIIRRRHLATTVVILGLAAGGLASLTTSAIFTDNEESTSSGITTGTVDIATAPASIGFTLPAGNLAPGDAIYAPVTVTNSGTLALRYAIGYTVQDTDTLPGDGVHVPDTTETEGRLSTVLDLAVFATAGCSAADFPVGATPLGSVDGPLNVSTVFAPLVGDPATGADENDRELTVQDDTEALCVRVELPTTAGNEFQGTSSTITLRFDAEQTRNN